MKICFFAPPSSVHTRRWIEYMYERGYHVELVTADDRPHDWPENWPVHKLPSNYFDRPSRMVWRVANLTRGHGWVPAGLWLRGAIQVRRLLRRLSPDMVHVHYLDNLPISTLLSGFHPVLATAWGSDLLIDPNRYTRPQMLLFRRALASADLFTCNSEILRQTAIRFGVNPDRIRIRQWGVNLDEFQPELGTEAFREEMGIDANSPVLLSPRTLQDPIYCLDGVLHAFRNVLDHYPEAILIQLGTAVNPDAYNKLKKLAEQLSIASRVRWFDFMPERELPLAFSLADITLSLSKSDSLPTSLLEAMASGSLPIFSDVGSIHEWIIPGENGMLVPPGNAEELTAAILDVLARPEEWWEHARALNREIVSLRANRTHELEAAAQDYAILAAQHMRQNRIQAF